MFTQLLKHIVETNFKLYNIQTHLDYFCLCPETIKCMLC